jgi:hypothetical protein
MHAADSSVCIENLWTEMAAIAPELLMHALC